MIEVSREHHIQSILKDIADSYEWWNNQESSEIVEEALELNLKNYNYWTNKLKEIN